MKTLISSLLATQLLITGPASAQQLASRRDFGYAVGALAAAMCLVDRGRFTPEEIMPIYKEAIRDEGIAYSAINNDAVVDAAEALVPYANARCDGFTIPSSSIYRLVSNFY